MEGRVSSQFHDIWTIPSWPIIPKSVQNRKKDAFFAVFETIKGVTYELSI